CNGLLLFSSCLFNVSMSLQENSRLENELLENVEKLAEYENLTNKLQRNLDNVLAEKVSLFEFDFLIRNSKCSCSKDRSSATQNIAGRGFFRG
ncbi:UNVERIFIED_CONTAM: hypothetical protein KB576_10740, partial [Streptococcus canis]